MRFDGEDVERFASGEAQTLALTDGEIVDAVVAAENFTGFGDDIAIAGAPWDFAFRRVGVDELDVIAVGDEAQFHAVRLFRYGERGAASDFADFVFREFAKRKFAARKLFLRESPKEIRLIFCGVEGTKKLQAARGFVAADAGVVAGGKAIGSDLASHAEKRFELHIGVAIGARDGSTSAEVVLYKGTDDAVFEVCFKIDDVMGKVEMLGNALGVVDIIEGATAVLRGPVTLKFRQPALIPELHGKTNNRAALLLQNSSNGGRVHAARHGDRDESGPRFRADRQRRFELGDFPHFSCISSLTYRPGFVRMLHQTKQDRLESL